MRRGTKLAAAAMMAAILPMPAANADGAQLILEVIREVRLSGQVVHTNPDTGVSKQGTMSFTLQSIQGLDVLKIPTAEQLDGVDYDVYFGLPVQAAGQARSKGCLTLKITGVTNETNRCSILDAQLTADPAMTEAAFVATVQNPDGWRITVNSKLEGTGTPTVSDEGTSATPQVNPQTARCQKSVEAFHAEARVLIFPPVVIKDGSSDSLNLHCVDGESKGFVARQAERPSIVVVGSVFDERPHIGFIRMLPQTFTSSIQTRLEVRPSYTRSPAICFNVPFAVVVPAGCYI
jgi:hypothetical protein